MESPNGTNSTYKWKKNMYHILNMINYMRIIGEWRKNTSKVGCCSRVNKVPPKGSCCHVLNSNEMIMKSSCWKAYKKYSGDGTPKIIKQMGNIDPNNKQ
jgi:hypothetical protein